MTDIQHLPSLSDIQRPKRQTPSQIPERRLQRNKTPAILTFKSTQRKYHQRSTPADVIITHDNRRATYVEITKRAPRQMDQPSRYKEQTRGKRKNAFTERRYSKQNESFFQQCTKYNQNNDRRPNNFLEYCLPKQHPPENQVQEKF